MKKNHSLPTINKLNQIEIDIVKKLFGIKYNQKKNTIEISKSLETRDIIKLYLQLNKDVWNDENILAANDELTSEPTEKTRIFYFGSSNPVLIDGFLTKMGLLNYDILIENPLTFFLRIKPSFKSHPLRDPNSYIQQIFEWALFLVYLEKWIRNGFVHFIPNLPMLDNKAFWTLGKINEELFVKHDFESHPKFKKAMEIGMADTAIYTILNFTRLMKANYTTSHVKNVFPGITEIEAKKILNSIKNASLEEREKIAFDTAVSMYKLSEIEKSDLSNKFLRSKPFRIERYLDVSNLQGSIVQTTGMPVLHASYISERYNCIPATDQRSNLLSYEAWVDIMGDPKISEKFELARSKIELPFTFFDEVPMSFVQSIKSTSRGDKLAGLLDTQWEKIRNSKTINNYHEASLQFNKEVKSRYEEIKEENENIKDEIVLKAGQIGFTGLSTFVLGNIVTNIELAALGAITTSLAQVFATTSDARRKKFKLKKQPLMVFLEAEKSS